MAPLLAGTFTWGLLLLGSFGQVFVAVAATFWAEYRGEDGETAEDTDPPPPLPGRAPWEQPGAVRRDRERNRGVSLLWLGRLSLCLAAVPCGLGVFVGLIAPILAVAVLVMASRDRAKMRKGLMDPDNGAINKGARYATAALMLSVLVLLGAVCLKFGGPGGDWD